MRVRCSAAGTGRPRRSASTGRGGRRRVARRRSARAAGGRGPGAAESVALTRRSPATPRPPPPGGAAKACLLSARRSWGTVACLAQLGGGPLVAGRRVVRHDGSLVEREQSRRAALRRHRSPRGVVERSRRHRAHATVTGRLARRSSAPAERNPPSPQCSPSMSSAASSTSSPCTRLSRPATSAVRRQRSSWTSARCSATGLADMAQSYTCSNGGSSNPQGKSRMRIAAQRFIVVGTQRARRARYESLARRTPPRAAWAPWPTRRP